MRARAGALAALAAASALGIAEPATAVRRTETIGASVLGRPIRATYIGPAEPRRVALVVGCIHGNECAAAKVLARLRVRRPPGVALWIIPTLNPDGKAAGTRGNADGVDLNRNFPAFWHRIPRSSRYYSGPYPASEPETIAALAFLRRERPAITIWFHQPETNVRDPESSPAARRYAALVGLPFMPLTSPPGTATRWQKRGRPGVEAFTVELPPGPLSDASASRHARAVRIVLGALSG